MKIGRWITAVLAASFLCAGSAMAEGGNDTDMYFDNWVAGPGDGLWSTIDNWHNIYGAIGEDNNQTNALGIFPNSISNAAWIAQIIDELPITTTNICILDGDYTVMRTGASYGMRNGVEQGIARITNPAGTTNTLTIDGTLFGDNNFIGCAGGPGTGILFEGNFIFPGSTGTRFEIDVPVVITNGGGNQLSWIRNDNNVKNETVFTTNSSLTILSRLGLATGYLEDTTPTLGSVIEVNCPILESLDDLVIQHDNVSFNDGHDSSNFGRDIVFQNGTELYTVKLAVNGGTVLTPFRKFQINAAEAELELNGVNTINGPDIVLASGSDLLLDVNADQDNMGRIALDFGTLTIDLDADVTNLSFADCSSNVWSGPVVVISNFVSEVVQFGTNSSGLAVSQLASISAFDAAGVAIPDLNINSIGYLTGTTTTDTPASRYAEWAALYPTLSDTSMTHDEEPDGVVNLMEYALGGNPTNDDAVVILPVGGDLVEAGGTTWMLYVYNRRVDAAARGLTYSVLSGTDLIIGMATPTEEIGSSVINEDFESVTNRMSTATENQQFMDLSVEFTN